MSDGNNSDTTTQTTDIDAKIKQIEAERIKLEEQNRKLESQVKGVETLVAKWGGEIGKSRKDIEEALGQVKSAAEVTDTKKILDRMAEIEKIVTSKLKGGESTQVDQHNSEEKTLKELIDSLSAEQKKRAREVFDGLPEDKQEMLNRNENSMKQFTLAAAEAKMPTSKPKNPFSDESQPKTSNEYRKLFGLVTNEENFVPAGNRGAVPRGQVADGQPQVTKRLPNGIIPRPKETQTT